MFKPKSATPEELKKLGYGNICMYRTSIDGIRIRQTKMNFKKWLKLYKKDDNITKYIIADKCNKYYDCDGITYHLTIHNIPEVMLKSLDQLDKEYKIYYRTEV